MTWSAQIWDTHSDSCSIKCDVPQGSILGPLLFLIYVNDMRAAVSCKLLLYADDSALLTSGKGVSEIEGVLSRKLESLSEWLEENRSSLHLGKTQSILFGSKKLKKSLSFQNMLFIRKDDTLVTERKRSNNKHMYKLEASRVN